MEILRRAITGKEIFGSYGSLHPLECSRDDITMSDHCRL